MNIKGVSKEDMDRLFEYVGKMDVESIKTSNLPVPLKITGLISIEISLYETDSDHDVICEDVIKKYGDVFVQWVPKATKEMLRESIVGVLEMLS